MLTFANDCLSIGIGEDGVFRSFIDLSDGRNYADTSRSTSFASIAKNGKTFPATGAILEGGDVIFKFGSQDITASLRIKAAGSYFIIEVEDVRGGEIDELVFINGKLSLSCEPDEPFSACVLGLNLQTKLPGFPGQENSLKASCVREFGFKGARAALTGCPTHSLRGVLKEILLSSGDLPFSELGGPWALDGKINRGSYIFDIGDVTEKTVDDWIFLMKETGFTQINFHGGLGSFSFGDFEPSKKLFPEGKDSLRNVIDRLHSAGIAAGLHTYSCLVEKTSKLVSPVPHPELGKAEVFTLAKDVTEESGELEVAESTRDMPSKTGLIVNTTTLQAGDEIIEYAGAVKKPPYGFTGCSRGAWGTRAACHAAGTQVFRLKESYNRLSPEYGTELFTSVAEAMADIFNYCGFDLIYFDALESIGMLMGHAWHHEAEFAAEVQKRLKRPALIEMSTFHHHLWRYRSRYQAWDRPPRASKRFIDSHVRAYMEGRRMLLPGFLGWWSFNPWAGPHSEPTYPDEIEYLCVKSLASDSPHGLQNFNPEVYSRIPGFKRLATIFRRYENLRLSGAVPEKLKEKLIQPGKEFKLEYDASGKPVFREFKQVRHKAERIDGQNNRWNVNNPYAAQPLRLRIESLISAAAYEDPSNFSIGTVREDASKIRLCAGKGITAGYKMTREKCPGGGDLLFFAAENVGEPRERGFCCLKQTFDPPLNFAEKTEYFENADINSGIITQPVGMGLWIHGDGGGEILNIRLRSPESVVKKGFADHYAVIDFSGWRYFELIEPESDRILDFRWPDESRTEDWKSGMEQEENISRYDPYRNTVDLKNIESMGIWYHNLPRGRKTSCLLGPVKAVRLIPGRIHRPSVSAGGREIKFPVTLESGQYLEFEGEGNASIYDRNGNKISETAPEGSVPELTSGKNDILFSCAPHGGILPRARISVDIIGGLIE